MQEDEESEEEPPLVEAELVIESTKNKNIVNNNENNNDDNALTNFANKLKQALITQPATFLISFAIFLLPLFLLSAFPESAWAVQSG